MYQLITAKASKLELIRHYNGLTLSKIVENKYTSIAALSQQYGVDKIEQCLCVLVADLNTTFEGELSKENIEELAIEISTGITRNHSLESIYWALNQLKSQDIYGKLTVNKILKQVSQAFDELSNAIAKENYNKHLAIKFNEPRETTEEKRAYAKKQLSIAQTLIEIEKQAKI